MERVIKFRAWVKSYEYMINLLPTIGKYDFEDGFVLSFAVDGYDEFGAHERDDVKKDDVVIMQFTGLLDKKGVEIYEGDIVRKESYSPNYCLPIVWRDCMFQLGHNGTSPLYDEKNFEVIGNIYEHPELLTPKGDNQ